MWFKEAKASQGSLRERSFIEAKKINMYGKYLVGNFRENNNDFAQQTATIDQVIRLEVVNNENEGQDQRTKTLNLSNIHDLQSRLMLLSREYNDSGENVDDWRFQKEYFIKVGSLIGSIFYE